MDEKKYSLTEHLTELRSRLLKSFVGVIATTTLALAVAPQLLDYSILPLSRVLSDRNRVEVVVVHHDEAQRQLLSDRVEALPHARLAAALPSSASLLDRAQTAISKRRPIDLVIVAHDPGAKIEQLPTEILAGIEPAPSIVYLLRSAADPAVQELILEGAAVAIDPPSPGALRRLIRRAAASAGKVASGDKLVVLSPLDPFVAYLKIALVVGLFLACPIWLFQAWRFVAPGLYPKEKGFMVPLVVSGSFLFVAGGSFAYFGMFPLMFDVLVNEMMPATLVASFTVDSYLSLLLQMTVAFGVVFELPLALSLLAMLGIVTAEGLKRWRRYWIVTAFIVAAVLTPADPFSQVAMAIPLVLFYEMGILAATLIARKRRLEAEASDAQAGAAV